MDSNTMSKSFFASTVQWAMHRRPTGEVLQSMLEMTVFVRHCIAKAMLSYLSDLGICPF